MRLELFISCNFKLFRFGFTLVELLVVVSILSVLSLISFPSLQNAFLRAEIAQVQTDMRAIAYSFENYYIDYCGYPITYGFSLSRMRSIDSFFELTTPICYLNPVPEMPWTGKKVSYVEKGITVIAIRSNYMIGTSTVNGEIKSMGNARWEMPVGGPFSVKTGPRPENWYSCTNGLKSAGGFWLDSNGLSSFK